MAQPESSANLVTRSRERQSSFQLVLLPRMIRFLRLGVLAHEDLQADPDKGELRYQNSWAHRISQDGKVVIGFSLTHVVPGSGGDFRQRIELFRWTAETGMIGLGLMPGQTDHNLFQYLEVTDIGQNGSVSCGIADMTFNGVTKRYPWLWTEEEGSRI